MYLIPDLGEPGTTEDWTPDQIETFAIFTYINILAFIVGIFLAILIWVKFSITEKRINGKCKFFHPMFQFYLWIILDFLSNIYWLIFAIQADNQVMPMAVFLPATFRILIGVEQIWLMQELVVQIDRASRILNFSREESDIISHHSSLDLNDSSMIKRENRLLKNGRIVVTILNISYFAAILIWCSFICATNDKSTTFGPYNAVLSYTYPTIFFILFILLALSVVILIRKLRANNRSLNEQSA